MKFIGRRLNDNARAIFEPGDYQKVVRDGRATEWWLRPPSCGLVCAYAVDNMVVEHPDGTVTIRDQIATWKLRRGVWCTP